VSRICTEIQEQMAIWQQRRLDELELDYLLLDASFFRYHVGAAAEPVLAAWGITTDGKPVFVGLDTSAAESTDAWSGFLSDLGARGLRCPLLVVSDGAAGLIAAVEQTMGAALRQRCLIHRSCKESRCSFRLRGSLIWYAHRERGPWSAGCEIRGVVSASE
jgi:putative transposase